MLYLFIFVNNCYPYLVSPEMVSESWEIKWFVSGKFGGMHVFDARRAAE